MSLSRRSLLSAMVYGGYSLYGLSLCRAESPEIRATHILQAKPAPGRREPPVVTCLAAAPDSELIAVGGDDHLLRIWNSRTGEIVHALSGHRDWIRAVQFLPPGDQVITAGNDRRVLRWTISDGGAIHQELARHAQAIASVSLDGQGQRLAAVGFESRLALYKLESLDASTDSITHIDCPCRDMRAAVFSPGDDVLASAGRNGKIRLWAVDDLQHVRDIDAHRRRIRALTWSPDGRHLASASEDRTTRIWNVTTGKLKTTLSTGTAKILCATWLDDQHLATGGTDNLIRVWDVASGDEVSTLVGHTGSVATLVSENGMLISGSYDTTVRIWHPLRANTRADRRFESGDTLK